MSRTAYQPSRLQLLHMPNGDLESEHGLHAAQLKWIPNTSGVYDYFMEADDAYYLTATSGFFPGEFGSFSPGLETTNWIGAHASPHNIPSL